MFNDLLGEASSRLILLVRGCTAPAPPWCTPCPALHDPDRPALSVLFTPCLVFFFRITIGFFPLSLFFFFAKKNRIFSQVNITDRHSSASWPCLVSKKFYKIF
jgi:hypothetical protein